MAKPPSLLTLTQVRSGFRSFAPTAAGGSPAHAGDAAGDDHRSHLTRLIVMDHEQAVFASIHGQDGGRIERLIHNADEPLMANRHIIGEEFRGPMKTSRLFAFL